MKLKYFVFLLAALTGSSCLAAGTSDNQGFYLGLFGGVGSAASASLQQKGAVLINQFHSLPIDASGSTGSKHISLGGAHLGYEWQSWRRDGSAWAVKPAVEIEGIYIGKYSPVGEMPVIPRPLGTQYVTIPTTAGILLANAVFTLRTPYSNKVFPYAGLGAGLARLSIKGSDSANPSEPGINHFNSDPDASDTAFAIQLKAGIKGQIHKNLYLFTEYRYLSVKATSYTFGSTDYPGVHLPTLPWDVSLGRQKYNLFVAGLQYRF